MSEEKEKKIPRLKADSSSTNEKKEKKKTSSAASGISVFFNFPFFFCSSHHIARRDVSVYLFVV